MSTIVVTLALPDGTGAPRMACYYCCALAAAGHRVVLVCGDVPPAAQEAGNRMLDEMRQCGVETRTVPELNRLVRPKTVTRVQRIIVSEQADCVISFQQRDHAAALWAAYRSGVPCVVSAQNQYTFWGSWPTRKLKETVFAGSARKLASLAVCTSQVVQRELVERFGLAREKTVVLPNGVEVRGFPEFSAEEKARVRDELGVRPDETLLLNVGRIDVQKGQDVLLDAFSRIECTDGLKLVFAGGVSRGGNQERMQSFYEGLEARVEQAGLRERVVFAGWRDDIPLLLSAADVYVHSARWEGWPLVLVEAMAAKRPVIGTDCAGRPEGFIDGVQGQIVPTEEADALRSAIVGIAGLPEEQRLLMGTAARQLAETHYDIELIGRKFVQLIEGVVQESVRDRYTAAVEVETA